MLMTMERGGAHFRSQYVAPINHFCTDSYANECLALSLTVFTRSDPTVC